MRRESEGEVMDINKLIEFVDHKIMDEESMRDLSIEGTEDHQHHECNVMRFYQIKLILLEVSE